MTTTLRSRPGTPDWLVQPEIAMCPCGCIGKRKKGSFAEKTLKGGTSLMRQAIYGEDVAAQPGLLQQLDPRVKLVTLIGLLVVAGLARSVIVLLGIYAAVLALGVVTGLSLVFFVKRVWLFIPIFTGIVVLPATLNLITPGTIVVPLGTWFGHEVGFTSEGLHGAAIIIVRVAVSISLVVLLTLTTPWTRLLSALRALFVPKIFILVLGMAYRYLFHLLGSVTDMYTARTSRTVDPDVGVASGRRFVAASAGALFGKAHALSDEVYLAMVARGYDGNARTLTAFRLRTLDVVWVVGCILAGAAILGLDRAVG
jgi:cobalt/nickel transport system permease protein